MNQHTPPMTPEEATTIRQIIIEDDEHGTRTMFPAPANKYVARSLWCFLVDHLQPGFIVILESGPSQLTRRSGHKIPIELYCKLMDTEEEE